MAVRVSSTAFFRYLTAQSTTRVAKVRDAKRMMAAPAEFRRQDYWKLLREQTVQRLAGTATPKQFRSAIDRVTDAKKVENYRAAATGLEKWVGRKKLTATPLASQLWISGGLEVSVTPELVLTWPGAADFVVKLYFSADQLSKYTANPMLRLIEHTHGHLGTAAILELQRSKLHVGPTTRPADLDLLLRTEAASFVAIWNSL